jgi:hypothetical protein
LPQRKSFVRGASDPSRFAAAGGLEPTLNTGNNGAETLRNQLGGPGTVTTVIRERVVLHNLPGVATFFFQGDQLNLPSNFRTVWKTRDLKD